MKQDILAEMEGNKETWKGVMAEWSEYLKGEDAKRRRLEDITPESAREPNKKKQKVTLKDCGSQMRYLPSSVLEEMGYSAPAAVTPQNSSSDAT